MSVVISDKRKGSIMDQSIKSFCLQLEIAAGRLRSNGDELTADHVDKAAGLLSEQANRLADHDCVLAEIRTLVRPAAE